MKQERKFPAVTVTRKAENSIRQGHPWVYREEFTAVSGEPEQGGVCDVFSQKGAWLGAGFYSATSKIGLRILSDNANEDFSPAFFERRVKYALEYRRAVMDSLGCCRLVFGEADGLPGLTVDKFSDILVAQCLCGGTDGVKDTVYRALAQQLEAMGERVSGLYERNEAALRSLEGLPRYKGWYEGLPHPESTRTEIVENGLRYAVDFENGQKTGFFLDQKYNRQAVAKLSRGKRVLDCFTHTGSFGLNAAKGGAAYVLSVDISESAIEMARENARRNGLEDRVEYLAENVFDLLPTLSEPEMVRRYGQFDFIILDPPAFTKSRQTVESAARGYKEINLRAMRLLPRGGYLATCSCSHFMTESLFIKMLHQAAADAGVSLRQIEARQQSPDHPILWNVEETNYLKFYLFQVV